MRHLYWTLFTPSLLCMPTFGQSNPHTVLHDALVLTNRGNFETAARLAKATMDSRQLHGNELGRGYIILAVAYREAGDLADAQIAFEHALQVLEHDRKHREDYASALENYAEFYSELGQLDVAAPMWRKAFHLRQEIGDHTDPQTALGSASATRRNGWLTSIRMITSSVRFNLSRAGFRSRLRSRMRRRLHDFENDDRR
jgi:tetratricopeptide (TPR) repeat protein